MEEILELIKESFGTLTRNKLRTGLAMLGIVIGIGSVITLIAIGEATKQQVENQIQSLGPNLLTVIPSAQKNGAVQGAAGGATTLTLADAQAISSSPLVIDVESVAPQLGRRAQVAAGSNNSNTSVIGVTPDYVLVNSLSMSEGSFITKNDVNAISKVAVLGPQVVSDLFPDGGDPIGQSVRVNNVSFLVVGVAEAKGGSGFANRDDTIYVPLTTAQKILFGVNYLSGISLSAKSADVMTDAENQVGYLLLARHRISSPAQADFSILSQSDILSAASSTTDIFTTLLSGVAAISLLVGGIGIMNIMLVNVSERTREIGLRKALGAKKKIITAQFLIESIMLTFVGGIIGVVLGIAASYLFSILTSFAFVVSFYSILLAFVVSAMIGIIFGWYPASRASNLQPIEALRYE